MAKFIGGKSVNMKCVWQSEDVPLEEEHVDDREVNQEEDNISPEEDNALNANLD